VGAIAVLGIHGPDAWNVARKPFRRRSSGQPELPLQAKPGRFWLGTFGNEITDEVVLTVKQLEPIPWLELHHHGGREVTRWLQETLAAEGIRSCGWQEFAGRTLANAAQAAALAALADAPTARTASILLDQFHGAFSRTVAAIHAAVEGNDLLEASRLVKALTRYAALGQHLTTPWQVVIAGAPNVGKSSLVNALAGFQRSVVAETPGTTRDVVRTRLAIDGWPVEVADTAGLRETRESLESEGVGLAREAAARADLCLWLLDAGSPPVWPEVLAPHIRVVINKCDLPLVWDQSGVEGAIHVSARTGSGLPSLCEVISCCLVPDPPAAGTAIPFSSALCRRLEDVRQLLGVGHAETARRVLADLWHDQPASP
jgi:tRNA modification GTPase